MDDDLKRLLESMRLENGSAHEETRRHFDVVAERLDGKIDAVAELLSGVDAKVDRESADIRERMKEGFSETQAMGGVVVLVPLSRCGALRRAVDGCPHPAPRGGATLSRGERGKCVTLRS